MKEFSQEAEQVMIEMCIRDRFYSVPLNVDLTKGQVLAA